MYCIAKSKVTTIYTIKRESCRIQTGQRQLVRAIEVRAAGARLRRQRPIPTRASFCSARSVPHMCVGTPRTPPDDRALQHRSLLQRAPLPLRSRLRVARS